MTASGHQINLSNWKFAAFVAVFAAFASLVIFLQDTQIVDSSPKNFIYVTGVADERFSYFDHLRRSPYVYGSVYFTDGHYFSFENIPPYTAKTRKLIKEIQVGDTLELYILKKDYYRIRYKKTHIKSIADVHFSSKTVEVYGIRFKKKVYINLSDTLVKSNLSIKTSVWILSVLVFFFFLFELRKLKPNSFT